MFRAHSLSLTSRLTGSPTLTRLARLLSVARLYRYSGSPMSLARLPTLASLLWPALRFRSLACLHYGFACSLARLLHGAQSYDPDPNQSFELRREPPLRLRNCRRRCGSNAGRADLARLPKPHSARRARIHPSRAAGLGCAIAPLCLLLSSPASQPHSCRRASKSAALPAAPLVVTVAPPTSIESQKRDRNSVGTPGMDLERFYMCNSIATAVETIVLYRFSRESAQHPYKHPQHPRATLVPTAKHTAPCKSETKNEPQSKK